MGYFFRGVLCTVAFFLFVCALRVDADTATTTITVTPPEACADGADNDFDGFIDYPSDIGCVSGGDSDETDPLPPPPPSTSGGGGSVSSVRPLFSPAVSFSGLAFPNAEIRILRDGFAFASTRADANGVFSITATTISVGSYVFTVVAELDGNRSSTTFFTSVVRAGSVAIDDIFLPPVISISENSEARSVSGYTVPHATVALFTVASKASFGKALSDTNGAFSFLIPHEVALPVAAVAAAFDKVSPLSPYVQAAPMSPHVRGDLNGDGGVNLVDLSTLVYWYGNSAVPQGIDLSGDGRVSIADISILLFYWTG